MVLMTALVRTPHPTSPGADSDIRLRDTAIDRVPPNEHDDCDHEDRCCEREGNGDQGVNENQKSCSGYDCIDDSVCMGPDRQRPDADDEYR